MEAAELAAIGQWLDQHVERVRPLSKRAELAWWEFATKGSPAAAGEREAAEVAVRRVFADPARYEQIRAICRAIDEDTRPAAIEPCLRRQARIAYLGCLEGQRDAKTLEEIAARETALDGIFHTFRASLGGRDVTENDIRRILKEESDEAVRREAWEASKRIGVEAAPRILELVDLRNGIARKLGFEDHFGFALEVSEIDERWLLGLLDEVAEKTERPYREMKATLDARLARRFGVRVEDLAPWHYSDPFFQEAPSSGTIDRDAPYRGRDLVAIARRFYEGVGMEVEGILAASDLEPRPGKCQHAFCVTIDRGRDIRVLSNNEPSCEWAGTMLHELGHAVYDEYLDRSLPYLLRTPAHALTTEAVAMLFGRLELDPRFLEEIVGVGREEARRTAPTLLEENRIAALVFLRWALVVVCFERDLYRNPGGDLADRWWNLVERFQGVRPPGRRSSPDWAAKIHLATAPVYYHNYILGELLSSQLEKKVVEATGLPTLVGNRAAGEFLIERVFHPGALCRWEELTREATGEPLGVNAFLARIAGSGLGAAQQ